MSGGRDARAVRVDPMKPALDAKEARMSAARQGQRARLVLRVGPSGPTLELRAGERRLATFRPTLAAR